MRVKSCSVALWPVPNATIVSAAEISFCVASDLRAGPDKSPARQILKYYYHYLLYASSQFFLKLFGKVSEAFLSKAQGPWKAQTKSETYPMQEFMHSTTQMKTRTEVSLSGHSSYLWFGQAGIVLMSG